MFKRCVIIVAAFMVFASAAKANEYLLEFTASDFTSGSIYPSPVNSVISGRFHLSGSSLFAADLVVREVSLEIAGRVYAVSDVLTEGTFTSLFVGGKAGGGAWRLFERTDDFVVMIIQDAYKEYGDDGFIFTVAGLEGSWHPKNFSVSYTLIQAVPEPDIYAMLICGMLLVAGTAFRRRS